MTGKRRTADEITDGRPRDAAPTVHSVTPRCSATEKMSLSPRPERFIRMISAPRVIVGRQFLDMGQSVRRFQGRNDPLGLGAQLKRVQRFPIRRRNVFDPADVVQPGVLRPDAGVIEAGTDTVRLDDLTVVVLQEVSAVAVQHAGPAAGQAGGVLARFDAMPARLDADQADRGVVEERMKQPHRVRSATDTGDRGVGQPALGFPQLNLGFFADH